MHNACSSCRTLSRYIISKSDTIAPLITIISSPLMIPDIIKTLKMDLQEISSNYRFVTPHSCPRLGSHSNKAHPVCLRFQSALLLLKNPTFAREWSDVAPLDIIFLRKLQPPRECEAENWHAYIIYCFYIFNNLGLT